MGWPQGPSIRARGARNTQRGPTTIAQQPDQPCPRSLAFFTNSKEPPRCLHPDSSLLAYLNGRPGVRRFFLRFVGARISVDLLASVIVFTAVLPVAMLRNLAVTQHLGQPARLRQP